MAENTLHDLGARELGLEQTGAREIAVVDLRSGKTHLHARDPYKTDVLKTGVEEHRLVQRALSEIDVVKWVW